MLYLGNARLEADLYSGFRTNTVRGSTLARPDDVL
jgi:hypothetical protein